jgi:small redox-active disulfide protein 2
MGGKMKILILGPGCSKCNKAEKMVKKVVAETGADATVEKVTDMMQIAGYGVMGTPAVVVNGEVKCVGKIPDKDDIKMWLSS